MITLRRDAERRHVGLGEHGTWSSFHPPEDGHPRADAFGVLAGFEELRIPPGGPSLPRPPEDVEVVVYVHRGVLAQEDSAGGSAVVQAGEFQRMTTGGHRVRHKETNASQTQPAHVFRIALRPSEVGLVCAREHRRFAAAQRHNVLCVVASPDGRQGSLSVLQDALVHSSILDPGQHLVHELSPGRSAWLHIIHGEAALRDLVLTRGDGVGVAMEPSVSLTARENTELLLVDLGPAM
jgi:redox-sensitive bicupin YhaK (pirin superfamily)